MARPITADPATWYDVTVRGGPVAQMFADDRQPISDGIYRESGLPAALAEPISDGLRYNATGDNWTSASDVSDADAPAQLQWGVMALWLVIVATAVGNILVCLAVCWDRRLQNMTNYFLMSLAIADLLVAVLVMPLGLIIELYGLFPLKPSLCVMWATMDVLMCTASIWHMCTMSMDRYFTLKYPMKYGRNKTKMMVALKIAFVWIISIAICSPLCIMGFIDYDNVFDSKLLLCAPNIPNFVIYGSVFAFYVPLFIMVVTYLLTTRILRTNQKLMCNMAQEQDAYKVTKQQNGGEVMMANNFVRDIHGSANANSLPIRKTAIRSRETSISERASVHESDDCLERKSASSSGSPNSGSRSGVAADKAAASDEPRKIPKVREPERAVRLESGYEALSPRGDGHFTFSGSRLQAALASKAALSVSQPHLPSMEDGSSKRREHRQIAPSKSHNSLNTGQHHHSQPHQHQQQKQQHNRSQLSVIQLESVKNFDSIVSLNSMLSNNWGSEAWSDFDDPAMFEKLSQIEAEMDECLFGDQEADPEMNATIENGDPEENYSGQGSVAGVDSPEAVCVLSAKDSIQNTFSLNDSIKDVFSANDMDNVMDSQNERFDAKNSNKDMINAKDSANGGSAKDSMNDLYKVKDSKTNVFLYPDSNPASPDNEKGLSFQQPHAHKEKIKSYRIPNSSTSVSVTAFYCQSSNSGSNSLCTSPLSPGVNSLNSPPLSDGERCSNLAGNRPSSPAITIEDTSRRLHGEDLHSTEITASREAVLKHRTRANSCKEKTCKRATAPSRSCTVSENTFRRTAGGASSGCSSRKRLQLDLDTLILTVVPDGTPPTRRTVAPIITTSPASTRSQTSPPNGSASPASSKPSFSTCQLNTPSSLGSPWEQRRISRAELASVGEASSNQPAAGQAVNCRLTPPVGPTRSETASLSPCGSLCPQSCHSPSLFETELISQEVERSTDDTLSDQQSFSTSSASRYHIPSLSVHWSGKEPGIHLRTFLRQVSFRRSKNYDGLGLAKKKRMMSKRRASNEKKASKVLGIIFAVFVVLWSPFFVVNIMTATCIQCRYAITPPVISSLVWLGYLSSLANPIIYTMFNTSFRRAFVNILTCRLRHHGLSLNGGRGGNRKRGKQGAGTSTYYSTYISERKTNQ